MTADALEVVAYDRLGVSRCQNPMIFAASVRAAQTAQTPDDPSVREDRS